MAAAARAAHLIVDAEPYVFADPLAASLLGDRADELIDYHRKHGDHVVLAGARAQVVIRSRLAEARLAASGAGQYVILGAGLDSFAHRSPLARDLRVFEVDHPDTQEAKRSRLRGPAGTPTYVPVDLEHDPLIEALCTAGLDVTRRVFVSWLGVSMYLTREAIAGTVGALATLAPGSQLVLDYLLPAGLRDGDGQTYAELVAPVSAERGEPWRSYFTPDELAAELAGFGPVTSVGQHEAIAWPRADALRPARLSMVAHATRSGR